MKKTLPPTATRHPAEPPLEFIVGRGGVTLKLTEDQLSRLKGVNG